MKTDQQPQLPFSAEPINWLEPLAFRFNQLRDVSAAADKAGFRIVRLKVVTGGYEAQCERNHFATKTESQAADGGKQKKETFSTATQQGTMCPPVSL